MHCEKSPLMYLCIGTHHFLNNFFVVFGNCSWHQCNNLCWNPMAALRWCRTSPGCSDMSFISKVATTVFVSRPQVSEFTFDMRCDFYKNQLTGDPRGGKDGWWSSRSSCRGEFFIDNLRKTATSKLTASSFECCRLNQGPRKKRKKTKRPIVCGVVAQCSCCSWVGVGIPGSQEKKNKKEKKDRKAGINALGEDVPITFHVLMICEFQWYCRNATQDESKNMLCHLIAGTGVWSGVLGGSFQLIVDISLLDRWKEASMSG